MMSEHKQFKFFCQMCDYGTDRKDNYVRHRKSKLHLNQGSHVSYDCALCGFHTKLKADWEAHCDTQKHRDNTYRHEMRTHHNLPFSQMEAYLDKLDDETELKVQPLYSQLYRYQDMEKSPTDKIKTLEQKITSVRAEYVLFNNKYKTFIISFSRKWKNHIVPVIVKGLYVPLINRWKRRVNRYKKRLTNFKITSPSPPLP